MAARLLKWQGDTMKGRSERNPKKQALLTEAIAANGGQVVKACKSIKFSVTTFYDWRKSDPAFAAAINEAIDRSTAVLETEAVRRALAGSDTMLIFLLKARVPDRYRERQEIRVSLADATADQLERALDKLSSDQLRAMLRRRAAAGEA